MFIGCAYLFFTLAFNKQQRWSLALVDSSLHLNTFECNWSCGCKGELCKPFWRWLVLFWQWWVDGGMCWQWPVRHVWGTTWLYVLSRSTWYRYPDHVKACKDPLGNRAYFPAYSISLFSLSIEGKTSVFAGCTDLVFLSGQFGSSRWLWSSAVW